MEMALVLLKVEYISELIVCQMDRFGIYFTVRFHLFLLKKFGVFILYVEYWYQNLSSGLKHNIQIKWIQFLSALSFVFPPKLNLVMFIYYKT